MTKNAVDIYTDGSCIGNPGPGGWGVVVLDSGLKKPIARFGGGELATTNNRMEMMAVIKALDFLHQKKLHDADVTLYSDSNLVIQTLVQGWKRKANTDLWAKIDFYRKGMRIKYVWVRGHANNKWNNECDKIAQAESRKVLRSPNLYESTSDDSEGQMSIF